MRRFDVIYKYKLNVDEKMKPQIIEMPQTTDILTVMEQDKQIMLYAKHTGYDYGDEFDWKSIKHPHTFLVLGTGWKYDTDKSLGPHVGTVNIDGFMWHVFRIW